MGKCDTLSDWEVFTDELGSHINLYEYTDIEKERFEPIAEYLRRGDFSPRFESKTIATDIFEDRIFLPEQRDEAARRIVLTYHTAAILRFENVQSLCLRKLRRLDALSPNCLLVVVRVVQQASRYGSAVEEEMLEWLSSALNQNKSFARAGSATSLQPSHGSDSLIYERVHSVQQMVANANFGSCVIRQVELGELLLPMESESETPISTHSSWY